MICNAKWQPLYEEAKFGFSLVNRTQQRVRGLPTSMYVYSHFSEKHDRFCPRITIFEFFFKMNPMKIKLVKIASKYKMNKNLSNDTQNVRLQEYLGLYHRRTYQLPRWETLTCCCVLFNSVKQHGPVSTIAQRGKKLLPLCSLYTFLVLFLVKIYTQIF